MGTIIIKISMLMFIYVRFNMLDIELVLPYNICDITLCLFSDEVYSMPNLRSISQTSKIIFMYSDALI